MGTACRCGSSSKTIREEKRLCRPSHCRESIYGRKTKSRPPTSAWRVRAESPSGQSHPTAMSRGPSGFGWLPTTCASARKMQWRWPVNFFSKALVVLCVLLSSCGYHVAGKADLVPKSIHTIAIPSFGNITTRYKLTDHLPEAISREFIARTKYQIVNDPNEADAVLRGAVINYIAYPTVFDQQTSRASGLAVNV